MTLQKLEKSLFYLLLFCLPFNLGKHFILPSSYVSGILVDYLIPTVYLTDIIILILLSIYLISNVKSQISRACFLTSSKMLKLHLKSLNLKFFLIIFSYLFLNCFFAPNQIAAFYKLIKIFEFSLLAIYIKNNINVKKDIVVIAKIFALSVIFQGILAIGQWTNQGSLFNNYLFFGEQPYTLSTPGIKKISFLGEIKAPPLGTFPHPNVLAGFLVLTLPFIFSLRRTYKWFFVVSFLLLVLSLFLTFSYPCWLAFGVFITAKALFCHSERNAVKSKNPVGFSTFSRDPSPRLTGLRRSLRSLLRMTIIIAPFLVISSFLLSSSFNLNPESFSRRQTLNQIAIKMFLDKPLFGVGLNNFTVVMEKYGQVVGFTRFLQPVHNGYLLILSETGLIGFILFILVMLKFFQHLFCHPEKERRRIPTVLPNSHGILPQPFLPKQLGQNDKSPRSQLVMFSYYLLFTFFFLLFFDHFLFTTQQGLLLTFILLSLC